MTNVELKKEFNKVINAAKFAGFETSKMEIVREWFTNKEFKNNLKNFSFEISSK